MGYNQEKEIAQDENKSLGLRYFSLLHCISSFTWLTRCGFRNELRHLYHKCGLKRGQFNSGEVIENCVEELDRQRQHFLHQLKVFDYERKVEKKSGKRSPSKSDIETLFDIRKIVIEEVIRGAKLDNPR